ncbi:MAG: DUF4920 domain-containing protein [Desulfobulbaceae bacterium]|nr:MAG: DUF4920 domain-containing protein [Desulfobulbaceae bacterium]
MRSDIMKRLLLAILLLLPLPGFVLAGEIRLGEPLTLTEVTKVSDINKNAGKYVGKRVLIEGMVINVCAARGCWMDISSDIPFEKIQVKVVDGEIVFPLEAKGRTALVEGIAEELKLSREEAVELARHQAMESGGTFDPATITGPVNFLRIRGLGAVIR